MTVRLDEVRDVVGVVPRILHHMYTSGELEQHWPAIRSMFETPEIPRPFVLMGILSTLTLRCCRPYCFVIYGCNLHAADVRVDPCELAEWFEFPDIIPEHRRWSRVLRLLALLDIDGPHRPTAEHALRNHTSLAEFESLRHVAATAHLLMRYSTVNGIEIKREPRLDALPERVRARVPEFVRFHAEFNTRPRPPAALCGCCQKVRLGADERWYPVEAAAELLPEGVRYQHGLCPICEAQLLAS
jgi:hypothetical protein